MSHFGRVMALALMISGCGDGSDGSEDGGMDATVLTDAGASDTGTGIDAGPPDVDAGPADVDAEISADAGPLCMGGTLGRCDDPGVSCQCCPAGGPAQYCLCTTECTSDDDCTDSARPLCDRPNTIGAMGICVSELMCRWGAVCAAPNTLIATPDGERPIASLREGDLVYSMHGGALVAVPLARVASTAVVGHAVTRVHLANGRTLNVSAPHPTADGRTFGDLAPGGELGGVGVLEVEMIPYEHAATHDILPASDTGTYVAEGVLIGSTLSR